KLMFLYRRPEARSPRPEADLHASPVIALVDEGPLDVAGLADRLVEPFHIFLRVLSKSRIDAGYRIEQRHHLRLHRDELVEERLKFGGRAAWPAIDAVAHGGDVELLGRHRVSRIDETGIVEIVGNRKGLFARRLHEDHVVEEVH